MAESKAKSTDGTPSAERKFPTEIIDLPSGGKLYPEGHPCKNGKIEVKYMTAKEEDILTSQNLIKKGVVIDKLLESLILTEGVKIDDLILGDKNAVMIASRILAYGPEYTVEIENKYTGDKFDHTFNLTDCPFKVLPEDIDYSKGEFDFKLPTAKINVKIQLLTGSKEKQIEAEVKRTAKYGSSSEITSRLRHIIVEIDGNREQDDINEFVQNMLSRDSLALREYLTTITPDIELKQEVDMEGELVEVDIPLTANFFWPTSSR